MKGITRRALLILGIALLTISSWKLLTRTPSGRLAPVMLWAWERPEDLSFVDCRAAGVAILAKTLTLDRGQMRVDPRRQPIRMPDDCATVGVVRIEAAEGPVEVALLDPVTRELLDVARRAGIAALQIDFDAVVSQRSFYAELIRRLRREMPPEVELTITALASWCLWDDWLSDLPLDDAVPMLFRMGIDGERVRAGLVSGGDFRTPACRSSLGLSSDEWPAAAPRGRRVYVFHPQSWSAAAVSDILERAEALR